MDGIEFKVISVYPNYLTGKVTSKTSISCNNYYSCTTHIQNVTFLTLNRKEFESKREVLAYRNKLIEDIIENCEKNLTNFSKTLEYETYLLEKVKKTINEEKREKIIIRVREQDLKFETQIKALDERIEIEVDKKNILGGFKLIDIKNSIEVDETFKTALNMVMQDFYKTSKLNLKNF